MSTTKPGQGLTGGTDFRELFESAPDLYLVLTPDLTIAGSSNAYLRATMTSRDEIIGKKLFDVFPDNPADATATGARNVRASLSRVLKYKIPDAMAVQKYDIRRPESEGGSFQERFWSPVNSPVIDDTGEIQYIIHRVEDVTEFVRLQQAGTEQHKVTEELRSSAVRMESEIYHRAQELQAANEILRSVNEELDLSKAGLEAHVKEATANLMRTNQNLLESEQQYRVLFENNPHPMWVFDAETLNFLAVNDAAVQHYGYTLDAFLSMTIKDIRPPEELDRLRRDLEAHHAGVDVSGLWRHKRKDGSIIDVEITSHDLEYAGRKAKVVLAHDVTERKKLEMQVLRNQRMESIGTLAGGIAHDLNNVLTPILMAIRILQRKYHDESDVRILETLEYSAQRGADMVKQVLAFGRGVDGERSVMQVKHLINELVKIIRDTFTRSIRVEIHLLKDLWTINGDATQLYQVLMNLCVNARDAMPHGGTLKIEAVNTELDEQYARMNIEAKPGPYVIITVTDTGTGIPPRLVEKVFEPFFTTKEIGKGTGLGLSTVLGIVKGHGGFITVYSEVGRGTSFKVYLPAAALSAEQNIQQHEDEPPSGNGELVLVVDDELGIREITKSTLEHYGYHVVTANDGTEALALYAQRREEIRVVVTDMMMPFMDGPATIRALRVMDPDVKIIAMSGLIENRSLAELGDSKSVRFLQKPFTSKAFLKVLSELLNDESIFLTK